MSICSTTSHHIIAQTIGGLFPNVAHGLTLLFIAEEYYKKIGILRPELIDEPGKFMGGKNAHDGTGFVKGLTALMDKTDCRRLSMSEYGIKPDDLIRIADMTVDNTGIEWEKYTLTKQDILDILKKATDRVFLALPKMRGIFLLIRDKSHSPIPSYFHPNMHKIVRMKI